MSVFSSYSEVPAAANEQGKLLDDPTFERNELESIKKNRFGLVASIVTLGGLIFLAGYASNSGAAPLLRGASTRACSFKECTEGGCDHSSSPYLCLDKATAFMGCSAKPWGSYCSDSCDLSDCASATPSKDEKTCKGIQCPADKCSDDATYQKCGSSNPYQCLKGSSAEGCSSDPYGWALINDAICSECCDMNACKPPGVWWWPF